MLLRQGIASLAGQLPVGEGLLPGFLQRDQGESAEPELGAAATDGEALHPAPAARGPDIEIEALAVAVPSGPADVAHEGGQERAVGMLAGRLALRGAFGECHAYHYTPIIRWMQGYEADRHGNRTDVQVSLQLTIK